MNLRKKFKNYWRVLKITKKPKRKEFWSSAKITALGIAIIGFIGFLIYIIATVIVNLGG